jgi:hypothetical protein
VLPPFNSAGDLPPGVHRAGWDEILARFGAGSPRRIWLTSRLRALLERAYETNALRRVFIWGSFVSAKPAPGDIDVLLLMDASFEVGALSEPARSVFDAGQAKLHFTADVFWARESIGEDVLRLWLDTYQVSRTFQKRGIVELEEVCRDSH